MRFFLADSRFPWRSVRRCSLLLCALLLIPLVVSAQDTPSGFYSGAINQFAGNGSASFTLTSGSLPTSGGIGGSSVVAVDSEGDVFFAAQNEVVGMVYAGGTIPRILAAVTTNASTPVTPIAGDVYLVTGTNSSGNCSASGITAAAAKFKSISGMWFDGSDNLYIADTNCYKVSEIDQATATYNVIGARGTASSYTAANGNSTINGASPTSIKLSSGIFDVKTDSYGNVYIADSYNYAVYVIYTSNATAAPPALTAEGVTPEQGDIYVVAGKVQSYCLATLHSLVYNTVQQQPRPLLSHILYLSIP